MLIALLSIMTLLAVNYVFGQLSGHVFADQASNRQPTLVWTITLFVGLIALLFVNVTTVAMMFFLTRWTSFNELSDWLQLLLLVAGYLGAAFAEAHGYRVSTRERIPGTRKSNASMP